MPPPFRVLFKFSHGIGDAAQFTVVLKHVKHYRPNWIVDVVAGRGKHSAFRGLCNAFYYDGQPRPDESSYSEVRWIGWYENYNGYRDRPNSKITNCLDEEFGFPYLAELGKYEINTTPEDVARARAWLTNVGCVERPDGRFNAVGLHYEGNTSTHKKNLGHHQARAVCEAVTALGAKVILFDWDKRSPLPNGTTVVNPGVGDNDLWGSFGSGDAGMITALVDQLAGFMGIDSGPGKCATATKTPCAFVWTGHNPLQFHDPADNALHLVPVGFDGQPPISGDVDRCNYFRANYRHRTYTRANLIYTMCRTATAFITGEEMADGDPTPRLVRHGPFMVRSDNFDQDLVIVQDVFFGDCYRTSLYDLTQWQNVVDVGGHIGTFPVLVNNRNPKAKIAVVEVCPENIEALTTNVGAFAHVVNAAMTYQPGELALLNAVRPGCESTGGSVVVNRADLSDPSHPLRQHGYQYWDDLRPVRKVSLRDVMDEAGMTHVDCLKLDCEGAEYSILENAPEVEKHVRFIFGEYHDHPRWEELRNRKFADWNYGKLHEEDGRGLFHLVNPRFDPTAPLPPKPLNTTTVSPDQKSESGEIVPHRDGDVDYDMHKPLARLIRAWFGVDGKPLIVETGVKQGHSALTHFDACPGAAVIGYDSYRDLPHSTTDRAAMTRNLGERIANGSFSLVETDTNSIEEYPDCDLFFIDGDHSYRGCFGDLVKASRACTRLVIDDYYPDDTSHPVSAALHWFLLLSPLPWRFTVVKCPPHPTRHLAVLDRSGEPAVAEAGEKWGGALRVACVAGVGDTAWVATKLPALVKRLGASAVDVYTCENDRANTYLQKLPFVRRVSSSALRAIESLNPVTPTGEYNYAPSQPNWHNWFHFFLQANGHLETGSRLEAWLSPSLPCDFAAPVSFIDTADDAAFADGFAKRGPYVTFFAGPHDGNTVAGHNVGGIWTPHDWAHVARELLARGIRVVLVGSGPGDQDYAMRCLYPAGFFDHGAEDCISLWELPKTLAVLRRAAGHVGYQSGLGVLSVYFGQPAVMFWQKYGVPLNELGATFREEMSTAWIPPGELPATPGVAGKNYFPAIYGRTDAATVAEFIGRRVLENLSLNTGVK